jgi:CPA2 family monovalent cation:H+ antiporter-2
MSFLSQAPASIWIPFNKMLNHCDVHNFPHLKGLEMHFPALIQDLAIILGVAALVTFLFRRIKQPVVLGYIVAGIIVGPYTPAIFSVTDNESIKVWAELGVIFLMFSLGLEFSFRRLAKVGLSAAGTGIIQVIAMLACGIVTAKVLGWHQMDAVFLGCMIAISSTTIIIKALEELGLKSKKFAELVFGILIVEDLVAILMLVALTNIATTSEFGGIKLLLAGGKLALVVGAWFLAGMFLVPRFIKAVSKHGNDEMLTVVASGLCLALVALAASFHYSVALGAFIMGSIIAESSEAKRVEHLIAPLKDLFGAVFFVSVGMLLDPSALIENFGAIILLSIVIVVGKILSVTLGSFITGQSVKNAIQTGFSMSQIGEFSFIIATLGLTYHVISEKLYPIIVASSLITTFTTPYLLKIAPRVAGTIEEWMPERIKFVSESYVAWIERQTFSSQRRKFLLNATIKWGLNAIAVVTIFTIVAEKAAPFIDQSLDSDLLVRGVSWGLSFLLSSPCIWAMFTIFGKTIPSDSSNKNFPQGGLLFLSRVFATALVGLLGIVFFPSAVALGATLVACIFVFFFFRQKLSGYYTWLENQFNSGFQADLGNSLGNDPHERLAPWDAHLVDVHVPVHTFLVGRSLLELRLREVYGLNIVIIVRNGHSLVAPKASETLYPGDQLLCFATDAEVERFKQDLSVGQQEIQGFESLESYDIQQYRVHGKSSLKDSTVRASGIREKYDCIVVGLERQNRRIRSPHSEMVLQENDILWVVGSDKHLHKLAVEFA